MDNHNVRELGRICVCLLYVCHCCVCVSLMYASLSSHSCKTNPCIASGSDDLAGREFWARIKSKSSCSYLRSRETFSKTRSTVILHWQCSNELTVQNCFFFDWGAHQIEIVMLSDDIAQTSADDDDCYYWHSWRNNVVIAVGILSSFFYLASHSLYSRFS